MRVGLAQVNPIFLLCLPSPGNLAYTGLGWLQRENSKKLNMHRSNQNLLEATLCGKHILETQNIGQQEKKVKSVISGEKVEK